MSHSPRIFLTCLIGLGLAGCGVTDGPSLLGGTGSSSSTVPVIHFTNNQAARVVIGQNVFTTKTSASTANTLNGPWGDPSVVNGQLYVNDYGNSRVLVYNSIPATSGAPADFAVGQPNLTSSTSGTTQQLVYYPWSTSIENQVLGVADTSNNRVLLFTPLPTTFLPSASTVIGQPNFTGSASGCAATALNGPSGVSLGGGKMAVADYSNNRVLIWNTVPTSNSVPADVVVGQANMTSCAANRGTPRNSGTLNGPGDVWTNGSMLIVADSGNHRILVWRTMPTTSGQSADLVLGQPGFGAGSPNGGGSTSASVVNAGGVLWSNLSSNGSQVFYADYGNNRVLIWNTLPNTNGAPADVVIGQPDFTSSAAANPPTATSLNGPGGITFSGNQFYVSDYNNNRVMVFQGN